jgi:hypothetical protein
LLQRAEDTCLRLRVLVVHVIADLGLQLGGHLGAVPPQLPRRALDKGESLDTPGWELVWRQGQPCGELLGRGGLGGGHRHQTRIDFQKPSGG